MNLVSALRSFFACCTPSQADWLKLLSSTLPTSVTRPTLGLEILPEASAPLSSSPQARSSAPRPAGTVRNTKDRLVSMLSLLPTVGRLNWVVRSGRGRPSSRAARARNDGRADRAQRSVRAALRTIGERTADGDRGSGDGALPGAVEWAGQHVTPSGVRNLVPHVRPESPRFLAPLGMTGP